MASPSDSCGAPGALVAEGAGSGGEEALASVVAAESSSPSDDLRAEILLSTTRILRGCSSSS